MMGMDFITSVVWIGFPQSQHSPELPSTAPPRSTSNVAKKTIQIQGHTSRPAASIFALDNYTSCVE
jgi:hypothetical protein